MSDVANFVSTDLETFAYFIYFITFCIQLKRDQKAKRLLLAFFYSIATFLVAIGNKLITLPQDDPGNYNDWVYDSLFLITGIFLSIFFLKTFKLERHRRIVKIMPIVLIIIFLFDYHASPKVSFHGITAAFCFMSIALFSFLYFYEWAVSPERERAFLQMDFWNIIGFFIHYTGSFSVVLVWNYLSANAAAVQGNTFNLLWGIQNTILFGSAIITFIASIWISFQARQS